MALGTSRAMSWKSSQVTRQAKPSQAIIIIIVSSWDSSGLHHKMDDEDLVTLLAEWGRMEKAFTAPSAEHILV
jgi:hypothetical protein